MNEAPVLICYEGSEGDLHAIEVAGALLGPRGAVVLDVAPVMTQAESFAAIASAAPGALFDDLNKGPS
jgi:hypothetical protein